VLAVSFSTPDLVGHAFGPRSREVQDTFVRLDETIGTLLNRLDTLVGKGQYVVALSADHGVAVIPEQLTREGKDAGRVDTTAIRAVVEQQAQTVLGPGTFVARVNSSDVYFQPGVYAKLVASVVGVERIVDAVRVMPGVAAVFRREEATGGTTSKDHRLRAAALGHFAGRSGDLIIVPKQGWVFGANGSNHGTASPDDQRVPVILMGYGIRPGQYGDAATPADIAPTLAVLAGVSLPAADGRPLLPALQKR
jgi:predicted AlkP superfamily pyrophosphatase or phosphodiesterase